MKKNTPLANSLRPSKLSDFFGQEKIIQKNGFLYQAIKKNQIPSIIFWGPAGSGKTTLAHIIAKQSKAEFVQLSAVTSGVKDLRSIIKKAKNSEKTILFIDEIHRWNKAQQDTLLPHLEDGTITLIGATTENPGFSINSPLLSRVRLLTLESLEKQDLIKIINRALEKQGAKAESEAVSLLSDVANGDARKALNILEICLKQESKIKKETVKNILDKPELFYDKKGDEHYNLTSAFIKSMRGSDPNASLYWLARMIESGEDPLFIARRLIIFASEDIGMANNSALLLANATFDACHKIGLPECRINLSHTVAYLAKSPKSNTTYMAYSKAEKDAREKGNLQVPLDLRNPVTKSMKDLGYGKGYKYPHEQDDSDQDYLPPELKNSKYM